jgi:hypothetical protein
MTDHAEDPIRRAYLEGLRTTSDACPYDWDAEYDLWEEWWEGRGDRSVRRDAMEQAGPVGAAVVFSTLLLGTVLAVLLLGGSGR